MSFEMVNKWFNLCICQHYFCANFLFYKNLPFLLELVDDNAKIESKKKKFNKWIFFFLFLFVAWKHEHIII